MTHDVWVLSGGAAIGNRTEELVEEADREIVLIVGHEATITDALVDRLRSARARDVTVLIGTIEEAVREQIQEALPEANVFVSELKWLRGSTLAGDETEISRLLLVDRSTILVSAYHPLGGDASVEERAVFGRGFENGLVTIFRRLMATGLLPVNDPDSDDS